LKETRDVLYVPHLAFYTRVAQIRGGWVPATLQ